MGTTWLAINIMLLRSENQFASCSCFLHVPPAPASCSCLLPPAPASCSCACLLTHLFVDFSLQAFARGLSQVYDLLTS